MPLPPREERPRPEDVYEQEYLGFTAGDIDDKWPTLDWEVLWKEDDVEDEWILEPLIPARRNVALWSPPKVGKSLLMLELAVGISRGTETLGVRLSQARHVLYVDFENDPRGDIMARLEAMGYAPPFPNLHYLSFPVMDGLDTEAGARQLIATALRHNCDLIVIDTISRAVDGDENDNDTWLRLYRKTGLLLKQHQIAMVRLDHPGKDESKGMRGGSAKYGDADAIWKLSKEAPGTYKLKCTDHRLPVAEEELVLTRLENPLRHKVEGAGWMAAADAKFQYLMGELARLGVPRDFGRDKAKEALADAGIKARNSDLSRAIGHRKTCPQWAGTGVDHFTCPGVAGTGGDRWPE